MRYPPTPPRGQQWNSLKSLSFVLSLTVFISVCAQAKPENLGALFQDEKRHKTSKKTKKNEIKIPPKGNVSLLKEPVPPEYALYGRVRSVLDHAVDLPALESAQRNLFLTRQLAESKALDKELDELFYAIEVRKAEKFAQKKSWKLAFSSFQRGLNGLSNYKWVSYWNEGSSKTLASTCKRNPKVKDEACLSLAKRVVDAFPKAALETKVLRDLPFDSTPINEVGGDRLSQSYTEKTEKDEKAFEVVLADFLGGSESELLRDGRTFIADYPKSILRFRALFLMGESQFKKNRKNEANEYYQQIIDNVPLSFYAVVSAERMGIPLRNRVNKAPVQVDQERFNFSPFEKQTLHRIQVLMEKKRRDEAGFELELLSRLRFYTEDALVYLMSLATHANQNLFAFRLANELIQRRYDGLLQSEFLEMVFPDRFQKEIEDQAKISGIDPLLVTSLMKQESGYHPPILSSSGAVGLMQLMPFTAIEVDGTLHLAELRNPLQNIKIGTQYLSSLLEKYDGNIPFAVAAYNAGPHRVVKWKKDARPEGMIEFIESIPFKETRDYVMSILRNRYWYQYRRGMTNQSVFEGWKIPSP